MKGFRLTALCLAVLLVLPLSGPALAAEPAAQESAQLLYGLGLFRGVGSRSDGTPDFDLDRTPTRSEAITMLVRLVGGEQAAQAGSWSTPFADVADWAKPYVGYAYVQGYTKGVSSQRFGGQDSVTAAQFLTFLLRALHYQDGEDFQWDTAWTLCDSLGITAGRYSAATQTFLRGDVAQVCAAALSVPRKGGEVTLLESLLDAGAIAGKMVLWTCGAVTFAEDFASFLFYPVKGSPGTFSSFQLDKVTVNGLPCETLQLTTPADVADYLASTGCDAGSGFCYVEATYDTAAAQAAATEHNTGPDGRTYPLLTFTFTYSAQREDGQKDAGTFSDSYDLSQDGALS